MFYFLFARYIFLYFSVAVIQMLQQPDLSWEPDSPSDLHTLIMIDVDIPPPAPTTSYLHMMVVNIPGSDVSRGTVSEN